MTVLQNHVPQTIFSVKISPHIAIHTLLQSMDVKYESLKSSYFPCFVTAEQVWSDKGFQIVGDGSIDRF